MAKHFLPINPESGEAIRNSPIEYYLVLCHGTFLLSDTVCCAKYNGRKHHIIETCFYGTTVRYRNGRIEKAQAQKDYTPIY
jgi:hypothetical protein